MELLYAIIWIIGLWFVVVSHGVEVENSNQSLPTEKQSYRTSFHFQPPNNWMNDPNGPMYYKGIYHLFYQHNPYSPLWGNISWGHSVSYDLINWIHLDHPITPIEPYDINGCWSGSATILQGDKPVVLYTGSDFKKHQVQNLAFPKNLSDPFLREWMKSNHNPLMTPIQDLDPESFRDPTTAWRGPDNVWRVVIGSEVNGHGTAQLYKSKNFVNWTRSHNPLHFSDKTGMWECPDFYPVSIDGENGLDTSQQGRATKHVLKASFNDHDYYILGKYDVNTDKYTVDSDFMDNTQFRYDYGMFYASKTFYDSAKKRRILWGWIKESDSKLDDINKGWAGLQSVPRTILLDKTRRQLVQWPVKEIEKLREKEVNFDNKQLKGGSLVEIANITGSQADVEVSFQLPNLKAAEKIDPNSVDPQHLCNQKNASARGFFGPFGLLTLASKDLIEQTAIFFRIYRGHEKYVVLMCSDQSRSSIREEVNKTSYGAFVALNPRREKISLRTLIDHSIVESFGGKGKTCMTARVYPTLAMGKAAKVYAFNNGTQSVIISCLSAWSMKKAQIAPLQIRRKHTVN